MAVLEEGITEGQKRVIISSEGAGGGLRVKVSRSWQQYAVCAGATEGLQEPISSSAHQVSSLRYFYNQPGKAGEDEKVLLTRQRQGMGTDGPDRVFLCPFYR